MPTGRTTARSAIVLLLLGVLAGTSYAAVPKRILFPVVGPVSYGNDFGASRGSRSHEGNDIMAARRAPVVAAEAGRVEIPSWSSRDCALILHGRSGTEYWHLHLNNDRGARNDNRGGCRAGVSYAPGLRNGQRVRAGQQIGFVGNSGNADGVAPHLHFELHPNGGRAVSPYRWLRRAPRLLYALPGQVRRSRLALFGRVVETADAFALRIRSVAVAYGHRGPSVGRRVKLSYARNVVVERRNARGAVGPGAVSSASDGERVTVWTSWFTPTLATQLARPSVLAAERIRLRGVAARARR